MLKITINLFHCLPIVMKTLTKTPKKCHLTRVTLWGGGRPRWKVVTLSSVFLFGTLSLELRVNIFSTHQFEYIHHKIFIQKNSINSLLAKSLKIFLMTCGVLPLKKSSF